MRGRKGQQKQMWYSIQLDEMVPPEHPLRAIKQQVDEELRRMQPAFAKAYSNKGRPSVPPEQLIKATLLQALYTIRSEVQLCEQITYNMLYRWFLDMAPDDKVWHSSTFSKNRERFHEHGLMQRFFDSTVVRAVREDAASNDHFSVDGTLIEAWASMKSFQPKDRDDDESGGDDDDAGPGDRNRWASFRGKKRSNDTHESETDPEARLMRKSFGQEAKLSHSMHLMMENRHGLLLDVGFGEANPKAERQVAETMLDRLRRRHRLRPKTLGADKGYDAADFLHGLEARDIVPHIAIRETKHPPRDPARKRAQRRSKQKGYVKSQVRRRVIEPVMGWMKKVAGLGRTRFIGRWKTTLYGYAAGAAYNFLRLSKIAMEP